MTSPANPALAREETLGELYRLVEALDRRVPHLERIGEAQIARDAADLRERAVEQIRQIEREGQPASNP